MKSTLYGVGAVARGWPHAAMPTAAAAAIRAVAGKRVRRDRARIDSASRRQFGERAPRLLGTRIEVERHLELRSGRLPVAGGEERIRQVLVHRRRVRLE